MRNLYVGGRSRPDSKVAEAAQLKPARILFFQVRRSALELINEALYLYKKLYCEVVRGRAKQ